MFSRYLIPLVAVLAVKLVCAPAVAQDLPPQLREIEYKYQQGFLETLPGTIGVPAPNGCTARPQLTGRYIYLVKNQLIYWGTEDDCVRVVINHQANNPYRGASYLGVQVIGFYERPRSETLVLRRDGIFVRNNTESIVFNDKTYYPDQITQEEFDRFHSARDGADADRALAEFEGKTKTGVMWHATPKGGTHNSWDDRRRFRMSNSYEGQLNLRHRVLENRLIAFTPYQVGADGRRSEDAPRFVDIHRSGAKAIAVRIFSPYSYDYGGEFALIFSTKKTVVANLMKLPALSGAPLKSLFAALPRRR